MSSNLHAPRPSLSPDDASWAFREAANILAEDAQIFAGKLEACPIPGLTASDAIRLFAKVIRRAGSDMESAGTNA